MATQYPGNAIPDPGYKVGDYSVDDELLYSAVGYTQKGVTLKAGQGVLPLGTPLTYDAPSKCWIGAPGGTGAKGLLRKTVDTGLTADDGAVLVGRFQANIVIKGTVKRDKVKAAVTQAADQGAAALALLVTALAGRDEPILGYLDF